MISQLSVKQSALLARRSINTIYKWRSSRKKSRAAIAGEHRIRVNIHYTVRSAARLVVGIKYDISDSEIHTILSGEITNELWGKIIDIITTAYQTGRSKRFWDDTALHTVAVLLLNDQELKVPS